MPIIIGKDKLRQYGVNLRKNAYDSDYNLVHPFVQNFFLFHQISLLFKNACAVKSYLIGEIIKIAWNMYNIINADDFDIDCYQWSWIVLVNNFIKI